MTGSPSSVETAEGLTVHVRFAPAQARRLRRPTPAPFGDLWAERPLLMERADGTFDLVGTATRMDGLVRWILSHGADATVEAPDRLRRRVVAEAQCVVQKYGTGDRGTRRRTSDL